MSALPEIRRSEKAMSDADARALLAAWFPPGRWPRSARTASLAAPPLLYVWDGAEIWLHNAAVPGHLRANIDANDRVCFVVDQAGPVFAYGRFECDTGTAYASVVAFGRIRVVEERAAKERFCDGLMAKYGPKGLDRPAGFYPRLAQISVYAIAIERLTGKATPLPALAEQWPALDRTRTPNAQPPG